MLVVERRKEAIWSSATNGALGLPGVVVDQNDIALTFFLRQRPTDKSVGLMP